MKVVNNILTVSMLAAMTMTTASAWCSAQTAPQPQPNPKPKVHIMHGSQSAYLGVNIQEVTPDRVSELKLKDDRGVEVTLVDTDAAAGKAGLRVHDVVVSFNGTPVEGEEQFRRLIRETPVGHSVQLGIMREGQPMTLQATMGSRPGESHTWTMVMPKIAEMPDIPEPPEPPEPPEMPEFYGGPGWEGFTRSYTPHVGIVAESLTPQLSQFFGAKNGEGVLVRSVEKGSVAEQAGLHAGDVITKVSGTAISGSSSLRRAFRGKSGNVTMNILRDKREQTLTLKLPDQKHSGLNRDDSDFDFDFDMQDIKTALKDLEPQMREITLTAQNQALKEVAKHKDEIQKQMEQARKELERSMKDLQKQLQDMQ